MDSSLLITALLTVLIIVMASLFAMNLQHLVTAKQAATILETRYRSLLESSLGGAALVGEDGKLLEWNTRFTSLLGAEAASELPDTVISDHWRDQADKLISLISEQAPGTQLETSFIGADGGRRWIALRRWPMSESGKAFWLLAHDVTRRRETRTLLRLAQRTYRSISEAILITDVTTRVIDINPAFERITGYGQDEAIGARASLLKSGRHDSAFFDAIWAQLGTTGCWKGEIWNRCRDGREIPCWMHIDAVLDPATGNVTHYVGVFSDISERKVAEERISFLAHHDPLTGLPNRFSLDAVLPQAIALARRQGVRIALLFVDLDRFKDINDSRGHAAGDQVLIETGRRLAQTIRDSDFLARIGGDEFVILLNEVKDSEDAIRVAAAIQESLRYPIPVGGSQVTVTPSIGISLFPDNGEEADTLLARADDAMYRVKADGRNSLRLYGDGN